MRLMRVTTAVLLPLAIVALVAAPPAGAVPPDPKVRVAKRIDGPFTTSTVPATVTEKRVFYVKVVSTSNQAQDVALFENATSGVGDFSRRWFKKDIDISHDVQTSGHDFLLRRGRTKLFRVRIKPVVESPGSFCLYPSVKVSGGPAILGGNFAINSPGACE